MALNITARLGLNKSGFDSGLSGASKSFGSAIGAMKGQLAALVGFGAVVAGMKNAASEAGKLRDMAEGLGISIETLQKRGFAMRQGSASVEDYERALIGIARARETIKKGGTGGDDVAKSFERLGVSVDDIKRKGLDELFVMIANAVKNAADHQSVMGDALIVMGKSASSAYAVMRAGIEEVGEAAHIMAEQTAQDLADASNEFNAMREAAIPMFAELALGFANLASQAVTGFAGMGAAWDVFTDKFAAGWRNAKALVDKASIAAGGKDMFGTGGELIAYKGPGMFEAAENAMVKKELEKMEIRERQLEAREKRKRGPGVDFEIPEPTAKSATARVSRSLTSLQQIGAFASVSDPVRDKQTRLMVMIAENTKQTEKAIKLGGGFP